MADARDRDHFGVGCVFHLAPIRLWSGYGGVTAHNVEHRRNHFFELTKGIGGRLVVSKLLFTGGADGPLEGVDFLVLGCCQRHAGTVGICGGRKLAEPMFLFLVSAETGGEESQPATRTRCSSKHRGSHFL